MVKKDWLCLRVLFPQCSCICLCVYVSEPAQFSADSPPGPFGKVSSVPQQLCQSVSSGWVTKRERGEEGGGGGVCVCKGLSFLPEFLAVGAWHCWAKITPLWRGGGVGESTNTVSRERAEQGCPGPSHLLQFWWTTAGWFWITTSHRYHLRLVVTQTSPPIGLMVSVSAWQQGDVKHSESFSHSAWFVLHPISVLFIPVTKMF